MTARSDRGGRRQPVAEQLAEIRALEDAARHRALTSAEGVRLDLLIDRDRQRARYRGDRIAHLRAELDLLEAQEREAEQRAASRQKQFSLPLLTVVRVAA
jgi:hypothetical protein